MEKMIKAQQDREFIMSNVVDIMGGDFESVEQEKHFDKIDRYLCECLGIDIKKFPTHID